MRNEGPCEGQNEDATSLRDGGKERWDYRKKGSIV
jgi:hypothetical protein